MAVCGRIVIVGAMAQLSGVVQRCYVLRGIVHGNASMEMRGCHAFSYMGREVGSVGVFCLGRSVMRMSQSTASARRA